jgi:hypothetical protein
MSRRRRRRRKKRKKKRKIERTGRLIQPQRFYVQKCSVQISTKL